MSGWIDTQTAFDVTGVLVTDAQLDAAEIDVFDLIRWNPVPDVDLNNGSDLALRQASALGRAIAWQAVYRLENPPVADTPNIQSESIGAYSYTLAEGGGLVSPYPSRVRELVARAGLMRVSGTSGIRSARSAQMIPVVW